MCCRICVVRRFYTVQRSLCVHFSAACLPHARGEHPLGIINHTLHHVDAAFPSAYGHVSPFLCFSCPTHIFISAVSCFLQHIYLRPCVWLRELRPVSCSMLAVIWYAPFCHSYLSIFLFFYFYF
ncbi:hypothetical protein DPX39_100094500 [Trypanosoma brucei equiperdum]|uniref:Uncharacterized protein n=1 Tax=Trypanosoma brucei equiperdum TaxID=630700 RepID=A0A3L6L2L1_9TRYP|nr:hypothetical protein DPX39_100094500 [Trypanosoma brucei equiperdum]